MFKIESYVTPILLSYVDKYVRDFKPGDAQVSLWGGGVALHNLVLKADVLQQEVALPFTLVSGRIHELLIQVPWTKIMSEPIIVTIDTIECILSPNPPNPEEGATSESPRTQVLETPPGYMQALVRRIVSNIALKVHHLIVKYVQDDIVLSLNVKHLSIDSAGNDWKPAFADIDQNNPVIRRLVRLDDLTLCLDHSDSDGKIRFYQEPLLYRCQLELKVLTRLLSANTRRATNICVFLSSSKLAWGFTTEQITLLLRLIQERVAAQTKSQLICNPSSVTISSVQTPSTPTEPSRQGSWSEWAWSWLPSWTDRDMGEQEAHKPAMPLPIYFAAYLDNISLVFKVMEIDGSNRKRARGILELATSHLAVKASVTAPTLMNIKVGLRALVVKSSGKCVCGHQDINAVNNLPRIYLIKTETGTLDNSEEEWEWPEEDFTDTPVELAEMAEEYQRPERKTEQAEEPGNKTEDEKNAKKDTISFWKQMAPLIFLELTHERFPKTPNINPYDCPPMDFEYSDWEEKCMLKVIIDPVEVRVGTGLVHRLYALKKAIPESDAEIPAFTKRTLTVEECDALLENLPQRRIVVDIKNMSIQLHPWDHFLTEKPMKAVIMVDVVLPEANIAVTTPLYPQRVCSAACQIPEDSGPILRGARIHVTAALNAVQIKISTSKDVPSKPCARFELVLVSHILLMPELFTGKTMNLFSYSVKMRELNLSGSMARLMAAVQVPLSLYNKKISELLQSTSLPTDALNDEELVALDLTLEDLTARGYLTENITTNIVLLQSARATLVRSTGVSMKQAWLFSAPDVTTSTPFLRLVFQWCKESKPDSLDYIGLWTEPIAVSVDPLFVIFLAYKPVTKMNTDVPLISKSSTSMFLPRRRATPPSSSGRGVSRSGSATEQIHSKIRSAESSSEPSERKDTKSIHIPKTKQEWWQGDNLLALHGRLKQILANVELGLVLVYVTENTASAVDCPSLQMAMERHAVNGESVLAISLGRWSMNSNPSTKYLWEDIKHDGPTILGANKIKNDNNSFPYKIRLADMSCYTLEAAMDVEKRGSASKLRSQIKTAPILPHTILELFTTTVTLSVVTKTLTYKIFNRKTDRQKPATVSKEEEMVKYYASGVQFKPSTLKEFVRGPSRMPANVKSDHNPVLTESEKVSTGPILSMGLHLHADTPPVIVKLEQNQVHTVAAAVHCFKHILTLLHEPAVNYPYVYCTNTKARKSLIRLVSEPDQQSQSGSTPSESQSDIISIFVEPTHESKIRTFFWFQWVISRISISMATYDVKLSLDIDDFICSIDLQDQYNQLKVKLTTVFIRHFNRQSYADWVPGELGGRILEAREPSSITEEDHFLAVTITQAQISNLPDSWKEELHPKLLETKYGDDGMWEIYATLAPLEAVLQLSILDDIITLINEMKPESFCSLPTETRSKSSYPWPFCYITAGGLRLLLASKDSKKDVDDTVLLSIGKVSINPHPDNPMIRQNSNNPESGWTSTAGGTEGRQYEVLATDVLIQSVQFAQVITHENENNEKRNATENPAYKWSQGHTKPVVTPILHKMNVNCVLAPAFFIGGSMLYGKGMELNCTSDCSIELSIHQLGLLSRIADDVDNSLRRRIHTVTISKEVSRCPYAIPLIARSTECFCPTEPDVITEEFVCDTGFCQGMDSGVETVSHSTLKSKNIERRNSAVTTGPVICCEQMFDSSQYLEVYVTLGMIEISLYVVDDQSARVAALRPLVEESDSRTFQSSSLEEVESSATDVEDDKLRRTSIRPHQAGVTDLRLVASHARRAAGNIALVHFTFYQPNLYYNKKRLQKNFQVSVYDMWVGLGAGHCDTSWHADLMTTTRGVPDPVTEIPPALATMKFTTSSPGVPYTGGITTCKGQLTLDLERPVMFLISEDSLRRLKGINHLVQINTKNRKQALPTTGPPALYSLRKLFESLSIDTVVVRTTQVGLSGGEGALGWDSMSLQMTWGLRPDRLLARTLFTSLLLTGGPPSDSRRPILHPLKFGVEMNATWESWRRLEGDKPSLEPIVRVLVDFDNITFDIRPKDLEAVKSMQESISRLQTEEEEVSLDEASTGSSDDDVFPSIIQNQNFPEMRSMCPKMSTTSSVDSDSIDQYYKDDLRSGAFKIVTGGQLPMAYQVTLHNNAVSWRYPHPRAITRLVAFPLPGQDKEIDCVLETYILMTNRWEPHTFFKLPVNEPREIVVNNNMRGAVFGMIWRYRTYSENEKEDPYVFNEAKFLPESDLLDKPTEPQKDYKKKVNEDYVSAEQLSGVLRIDSYFCPKMLSSFIGCVRLSSLNINLHNSIKTISSDAYVLEGYYVSKPLMRSHRVLTLTAKDTSAYILLGSAEESMVVLNTYLSSDILHCTTGTMEQIVDKVRTQAVVTFLTESLTDPRFRLRSSRAHVRLHPPRLRTLMSLAADWQAAVNQYNRVTSPEETTSKLTKGEIMAATATALEGLVSLWIHNSCNSALRIGQQETDEVLPLGPGARLAFRWRNPTAIKRLRIALAAPTADWHWSDSVPFSEGSSKVRLEDATALGGAATSPGSGVFVYVDVEQMGSQRLMHLSGRLVLANMLRFSLLYKVRAHFTDSSTWRTVTSGELYPETVGRSVLCGTNCDMVLKVRFTNHETGWSGDIPLKECPKENVPWLVKVPSDGDMPYISVWCRVVRTRNDGRILATIWPLYVLHSHLPLDADVLIATTQTETEASKETSPPPLILSAPGRGCTTHLLAPGTTAARHTLSFQYRNMECPVTREAVPMHYGVTDTSVFEKRVAVNSINDILEEIRTWLVTSRRGAVSQWPYSIVKNHWPDTWKPALVQPRCDVSVRYRAIRAGGGCSLEIQLCPMVLMCNASSISLTLRAFDASPLCKLEPGTAMSPPSIILKKPFFMSVEMDRETFVSGQLEMCTIEPGQYGTPPPGQLAIDFPINYAIQCNHKVALLTMHYEIKENINVLGVTPTFVLINKLDTKLLVSTMAVPKDIDKIVSLRPTGFKVVDPVPEGSSTGVALCRFWLRERWRGGDPSELQTFICLALPEGAYPARPPVPLRVGEKPQRRPLALIDSHAQSVPVVVTTHKHEGRWLVCVAEDPCPQFVVYNNTFTTLAIGHPVVNNNELSTVISVTEECPGTNWRCILEPDNMIHYSTGAHGMRHTLATDSSLPVPFLTFTTDYLNDEPDWCSPVAIAEGEQLVQVTSELTIKVRVRTHPHSTLIKLLATDKSDISASDIRRRLLESRSSLNQESKKADAGACNLERVCGTDKLLDISKEKKLVVTINETENIIEPKETESKEDERKSILDNTVQEEPEVNEISGTETEKRSSEGESSPFLDKKAQNMFFEEIETKEDDNSSLRTEDVQNENEVNAEFKILLPSILPHASSVPAVSVSSPSQVFLKENQFEAGFWEGSPALDTERFRCVLSEFCVEFAAAGDKRPLIALHLDRASLLVLSNAKKTTATMSIMNVQVDNLQYESGQYDFQVVATTRAETTPEDPWPTLWTMFSEMDSFSMRELEARVNVTCVHDKWTVAECKFTELTEVDINVGPLAVYVEDAYIKALIGLFQLAFPSNSQDDDPVILAEIRALQRPLRLRYLHIHPLDLTLTLHTAMRMYIALDHSPLHLSAFVLRDTMTSMENLVHALTVHYLSAAILGAGWVVGGLELLGAPGALAARVGGATGGVRGLAAATAAGLLRSLSVWAGSLARNLDLLAGDEEHARRAAAARRRPPDNFMAGLLAGFTNFAINILGAVGGLAHHPLVGIVVGESEGSAMALRRGLLGVLTKPLSATADLVAYAGHGLLKQTGWDPEPQPRSSWPEHEEITSSWRRDCVRWTFRFAELSVNVGFEVLLDNAPLTLLLTHKFLVVADPESERIVEMIDLRYCSLGKKQGPVIELCVAQRRQKNVDSRGPDEDDEYQISVAAMARVARYTGTEGVSGGGASGGETRVLSLLPVPGQLHDLHAALSAAIHHNSGTHFQLL